MSKGEGLCLLWDSFSAHRDEDVCGQAGRQTGGTHPIFESSEA
jgi:hypothetical protein